MNKEILMVTEAVSNEKGVERDIIFEAIEQALEMATKKRFEEGANIRVVIDRETGGYESFRWWEVVADDVLAELGTQFTTEEAYEKDPDLSVGDLYEERVENAKFGRIAAQAAKQVIVQRVKEAEREIIVDRFKHRVGELLNGTVKKVTREHVVIDFGDNAEGLLPREQLVGREIFRINDRTRTILMAIREDTRGPQLLVSRISPEMLIQLFRIEVPEIAEGVIEIKGAARDPGQRAKIAVKSKDARIDPVGACVGMRGARVQAVSNDLDDERVDIVLWDDNPAQLVINAMAPAEVGSIVVDEESHSMDVAVNEENLAQAIGKGGQNVRLASELTGWNINVMTLQDAEDKQMQEATDSVNTFMQELDIGEDIAIMLVEEGFSSLEEVAYVSLDEMSAIEGFDQDLSQELRIRAKDALLTMALASEGKLTSSVPADDLLNMEGMDKVLAHKLAAKNIITMEDLAEQAVDDISDIDDLSDQRAAELIMTARAPWFA
ncbi:MAG: transcription termination/antitermination protein NusA [Cellvibrionales bacterium TMED49]|nr:transcription termination/antitermination protein NusA [Porticoccaceae bacterium]OUU37124.1 MAG: transcription termination/antitermination protein NusA [Cellvibrionales bacterium TMED49]